MEKEFIGKKSRYRLRSLEPIAYGRLSTLLLAEDCASGIGVVLKTFRESIADPDSLDGFYREIDAVSRLRHKNILEIFDYGNEPHFLVLPYMSGGNLRNFIRGRTFSPVTAAVPLLRQIGDAIDFAHAFGVIHGDIKPENILLNEDHGNAFLSDFGVARHFDTMDRTMVTVTNPRGGGTSAYLSPEQLSDNRQSPKSDIYSFGLVTYELLVGRLPFDVTAPLYRQIHARVTGDLLDPEQANPALPRRVASALRRALDPSPEKRPVNATGFISMLELSKEWDVFIAHAGPDSEPAGALYEALASKMRVFLDIKCLRLGDNWDSELARAQRKSLITVVLVSPRADEAYYAREEIACAIRMARENPSAHRVVPIFLEESSFHNPPYGLALKHGLLLDTPASLPTVAESLDRLVQSVICPT